MKYDLPIMVLDPDILPETYRRKYAKWNWAYGDEHLTDIPPHGEIFYLLTASSRTSILCYARTEFPGALLFRICGDREWTNFRHLELMDLHREGYTLWQAPNPDLVLELKLRFG